MDIHVNDIKAYVYVLVSMCGEVEKKVLLDAVGSPSYGRRAIMSLRDDAGVLTEKSVGSTTILRLKKPSAWKILEQIPELQNHYETTTNGHQFKSSPAAAVMRDIRKGELILYAISNGIEVNLLKIDYESQRGRRKTPPAFWESVTKNLPAPDEKDKRANAIHEVLEHIYTDSEKQKIKPLKTYQEIVDYMLPNNVYLFTSQEVKRYKNKDDKNSPTLSINTSRSFGHIIGKENSYAVYLMNEGLIKLNQETESRYRDYLENVYRQVYGNIAASDRRNDASHGACILFVNDIDNIENHIRYPNKKYKNTELSTTVCDIYSSCYVVPLNNKTAIQRIIEMNWKTDLLVSLFADEEIAAAEQTLKGYCDAIIDDTMAIELISMDIKKIETTLTLLSKSEDVQLIIYCEPWQEKAIRKIYSPYKKQIQIEPMEVL